MFGRVKTLCKLRWRFVLGTFKVTADVFGNFATVNHVSVVAEVVELKPGSMMINL